MQWERTGYDYRHTRRIKGGFAFLVLYLIFVVVVGYILTLTEFAIGRHSKSDPVGAYGKIHKRWAFVGWISVICSFMILSFYSVLGGWVMKYAFTYVCELLGRGFGNVSGSEYFASFISNSTEPIIWQLLFMLATGVIVMFGVEQGIERSSKIMMPILFVMMLIIIARSLTLPGAMAGISFMFKPDFSVFKSIQETARIAGTAMAQMFWSLSLAMGITITYGSYLGPKENLQKNAVAIPILDTIVALLAGLAIMPAVFAFGLDPASGPGLMFITLYEVFHDMPLGTLFGLMFYILVLFAALTSAIALLEVSVATLIDVFCIDRKKAALFMGIGIFLIGIPAALSQGVLADVRPIMGRDIIDSVDFLGEYTLMPIGAILSCFFVKKVWGIQKVEQEVSNRGEISFRGKRFYEVMIGTITPILIFLMFLGICVMPLIQFYVLGQRRS